MHRMWWLGPPLIMTRASKTFLPQHDFSLPTTPRIAERYAAVSHFALEKYCGKPPPLPSFFPKLDLAEQHVLKLKHFLRMNITDSIRMVNLYYVQ